MLKLLCSMVWGQLKMVKEKIIRKSNFELMRILSMIMIVAWHVIIHGHVFSTGNEVSSFLGNILISILVVHVNSLVFVTGYFNYDKDSIKPKKCLKLIGVTWFYKAVILIICLLLGIVAIDKVMIMEELLPLDINNYWFINYYLVLYIISPYLNKVTKKMTEKEFFNFLLILFVLLSIIPIIDRGRIINNNGSNIVNFVLIYYLGSYFHKYPIKDNYHFKDFSKRKLIIVLLLGFFTMMIGNLSTHYLGEKMITLDSSILKHIGTNITSFYTLYSNPFVIIQSCIYCLIFANISFKSKIVNFASKATFGIYLIHDNHFLRDNIYKGIKIGKKVTPLQSLTQFLIFTLIIFISCFIIENVRILLTKLIKIIYYKIKKRINIIRSNRWKKEKIKRKY